MDAGCGTGASTAALLSVAPYAEIVAVDASQGMLDEAQAKSWPPSVRFVHTRVEALAENGVVGPFDGILAAYLMRNLADPDTQLRALRDLLHRAPRWRYTTTRYATPVPPPWCGTRCAGASSSPPAGCTPATRRCIGICGAAC